MLQLTRKARARRGFTLIELLVVVLILAILMAVALPLYLSAVKDSETKTCRSNLQTIANAVHAARVKARASDYSGFVTSDLSADIGKFPDLASSSTSKGPQCPTRGTYSVETTTGGGFVVKCSVSEHGTFEPGTDSK